MNNLIKVCVLIAFSLMSFVFSLFCFTAQTDFSFVVCITTEPISQRLYVCDASRILTFGLLNYNISANSSFIRDLSQVIMSEMFSSVHSVIRTITSWCTLNGY